MQRGGLVGHVAVETWPEGGGGVRSAGSPGTDGATPDDASESLPPATPGGALARMPGSLVVRAGDVAGPRVVLGLATACRVEALARLDVGALVTLRALGRVSLRRLVPPPDGGSHLLAEAERLDDDASLAAEWVGAADMGDWDGADSPSPSDRPLSRSPEADADDAQPPLRAPSPGRVESRAAAALDEWEDRQAATERALWEACQATADLADACFPEGEAPPRADSGHPLAARHVPPGLAPRLDAEGYRRALAWARAAPTDAARRQRLGTAALVGLPGVGADGAAELIDTRVAALATRDPRARLGLALAWVRKTEAALRARRQLIRLGLGGGGEEGGGGVSLS